MAEMDRLLSQAQAQAMQEAGEAGAWVLTSGDPRHPGKFVARGHSVTFDGGSLLAAVLVADTLEALRAQLPAGVARHDMHPGSMPVGTIEIWD